VPRYFTIPHCVGLSARATCQSHLSRHPELIRKICYFNEPLVRLRCPSINPGSASKYSVGPKLLREPRRWGVAYVLRCHTEAARRKCSTPHDKQISPHVIIQLLDGTPKLFDAFGIAARSQFPVTGVRRRHRRSTVLTPELEQKIVDTTVKTRPGDGSTDWSVRTPARQLRVSRTIVHRVWHEVTVT
jgi:hypothetical protein